MSYLLLASCCIMFHLLSYAICMSQNLMWFLVSIIIHLNVDDFRFYKVKLY